MGTEAIGACIECGAEWGWCITHTRPCCDHCARKPTHPIDWYAAKSGEGTAAPRDIEPTATHLTEALRRALIHLATEVRELCLTEERRCDGIAMGPEGSDRVQDVIDTLEELRTACPSL